MSQQQVEMKQQHVESKQLEAGKQKRKKNLVLIIVETIAVLISIVTFIIPFYFIIITAMKTGPEAARFTITWPTEIRLWQNIIDVFQARDYMLVTAFFNSTVITTSSVLILAVACSMGAFVLQRRQSKLIGWLTSLFLAGLMIPSAVVPTIWVLEQFGLFKTMPGIILVMVALSIPFCIVLYTGFIATIPKEIDEAAIIDGCDGFRLYFRIIFPLLKPIHSTIIIITSVNIFNDFVHPLYFFPGADNATVQLTLYNFMSLYNSDWNLLFANVLLITIPPFVLFLVFSEKIVAGMTAGSVKG
ncbi:carbohydrate ABC transporter permease [Aquibacillus albus]|uniref:Raffinose/stachyose/melibiose transport system permease protein n=1 Tax=Aquibacillus albus TaxID=1168171 RepID=A0ABS2MWJ4_9BACI|nr:carbohydrate ABC transporter permease [Aquibacillus albus]MBM7570075.1 raffinose/stachyose/melibiose transport system permease protein [Aquibacillus albus]